MSSPGLSLHTLTARCGRQSGWKRKPPQPTGRASTILLIIIRLKKKQVNEQTPQTSSESLSHCHFGGAGTCFEFSLALFPGRLGSRRILLKSNAGLRKAHLEREQLAGRKGFIRSALDSQLRGGSNRHPGCNRRIRGDSTTWPGHWVQMAQPSKQ